MKISADILVVGGGIGGTVLAECLGRRGRKVVVLERSTAPPPWVRPEILWPSTVESLFALLPRDVWERQAMLPLRGLEAFDGTRPVLQLTSELLDQAGVAPWSTNPNVTRELLLGLDSFELHRGVEAVDTLREKGRVAGLRARRMATGEVIEVRAPWTVADDGANSIVRRASGVVMTTRFVPVEALAFQFDWPAALPAGIVHAYANLQLTGKITVGIGFLPLPAARGVGIMLVPQGLLDDAASVGHNWTNLRAQHPVLNEILGRHRFPQDFTRLQLRYGHAPCYGVPGAVFLGDAAHAVTPVGGQGANMSVADARVLGELFSANPSDLIQEYERRRRPANARSLRLSQGLAFLLGLPEWCRPGLPFILAMARRFARPPRLQRALHWLSTAFVERPTGSGKATTSKSGRALEP